MNVKDYGTTRKAKWQPETMKVEQHDIKGIALNVTRTRITVLVFNLTIITFMISIMSSRSVNAGSSAITHLTSSVALFVGFCLTILGLMWLLYSQNCDEQGLGRPWPFTLGSMTMYLALSQTVTAFMHEYLIGIQSALEGSRAAGLEKLQPFLRLDALDDIALSTMFVMGGVIWFVVTYIAPLAAAIKAPVLKSWRWVLVVYYFTLQVPVYWVYARAWHLEYAPSDQPENMPGIFILQFAQPLLWFN